MLKEIAGIRKAIAKNDYLLDNRKIMNLRGDTICEGIDLGNESGEMEGREVIPAEGRRTRRAS